MTSLASSTVAIVGVGLLGGSLGLALAGRCDRRIGVVGPGDERAARDAQLLGAVEDVVSLEQACAQADIVVLATPVRTIEELVPRVAQIVRAGTLVTDVGSTKAAIVAAMRAASDTGSAGSFAGGHPMAGGSRAGVTNATATLFEGVPWVVCEAGDAQAAARTRAMAEAVGAHVVELDAEEHDRAAALASHLPYVVAQALVHRMADREDAQALAAAGWRRATQGAQMDPGMWRDILITNAGPIADELEALRDGLDGVARALRAGNDPLAWLESGAASTN